MTAKHLYLSNQEWTALIQDKTYCVRGKFNENDIYSSPENVKNSYIKFTLTTSKSKDASRTLVYSKRKRLMHQVKSIMKGKKLSVLEPMRIKAVFLGYGWVHIINAENLKAV